jgi:DNA-binding transcriptional regulator YbjK
MAVPNVQTQEQLAVELHPFSDPVTPQRDGRRARGDARRHKIIESVLTVIAREGVQGVTQRVVAKEAGVSPASVQYYFTSVNELLAATLQKVNATYLDAIRQARESERDPLVSLAEITCAHGDASRKLALAEFEVYLLATRDPVLRREMEAWWAAADDLIASVVADPARRRAILSLADGTAMRSLIEAEPASPATVAEMFRLLAT